MILGVNITQDMTDAGLVIGDVWTSWAINLDAPEEEVITWNPSLSAPVKAQAEAVLAAHVPFDDTQNAKVKAKFDLGLYYQAYSTSQFTAGSDIFPANNPTDFLVISEVLRLDPSNSSQVVFDIEGDPHPVANAAAWANFWDQYVGIFDDARSITGTAWQNVKAATTEAGVQAVMDALPPIPGS